MIAYLNVSGLKDIVEVEVTDKVTEERTKIGCIVDATEETIAALKAQGLVDWVQGDGLEALPARWKDTEGNPLHVVFGYEPHVAVVAEPIEEPIVK